MELSVAPLPANQDALVLSVARGDFTEADALQLRHVDAESCIALADRMGDTMYAKRLRLDGERKRGWLDTEKRYPRRERAAARIRAAVMHSERRRRLDALRGDDGEGVAG